MVMTGDAALDVLSMTAQSLRWTMDCSRDSGDASSPASLPLMFRGLLSSRCSNDARKWATLGILRVWSKGIGVSGLGLKMG